MQDIGTFVRTLLGLVTRPRLRFRYIHEPCGIEGTSTLLWEGVWPSIDGQFPREHPSNRYHSGFALLIELGYELIFPCEGDRCQFRRLYNQPKTRVHRNLDDCLGWRCTSAN